MKNLLILLLICVFEINIYSQKFNHKEEEIKLDLILSYVVDLHDVQSLHSIENHTQSIAYIYEHTEFYSSNTISCMMPISTNDSSMNSYNLQLFKIVPNFSDKYALYMLKYEYYLGTYCKVWLRASGYVENDMNLLFDFFMKHGVKKKQLFNMIEEWEMKDEMFKELDLKCILNGYLKNNTSKECFNSSNRVFRNILCMNCVVYDKVYSNFSRIPYSGTLILEPKNKKYKERLLKKIIRNK